MHASRFDGFHVQFPQHPQYPIPVNLLHVQIAQTLVQVVVHIVCTAFFNDILKSEFVLTQECTLLSMLE
jgi:hypothetical protein